MKLYYLFLFALLTCGKCHSGLNVDDNPSGHEVVRNPVIESVSTTISSVSTNLPTLPTGVPSLDSSSENNKIDYMWLLYILMMV